MTSIGSSSSSPASYVASIAHRAFGGVKSMSLSTADPVDITMAYDTALRPTGYIAHSDANTSNIHEADYTYYNDGMLDTLVNDADPRFGQKNKYDFAGRLKENDVGSSGSGYVFIQSVGYDAFSNMTDRTTHTWGSERSFEAGYANNRKTAGGATTTYNNAGNVTYSWESNNNTYTWFDAAGRTQRWEEHLAYSSIEKKGQKTIYDGDGRPVKEVELTKTWTLPGGWTGWSELPSYYLYSSVTGQKITQLDLNGGHAQTFVNMGSTLIAQRDSSEATFHVTDPVTGSVQMVNQDGEILNGDESRHELAGIGTLVPHTQPPEHPTPDYENGGFPGNPENGCEFEGTPVSCSLANWLALYVDKLPKPGVKPPKDPKRRIVPRHEGSGRNSQSLTYRGERNDEEDPGIIIPETFVQVFDTEIPGMVSASESNPQDDNVGRPTQLEVLIGRLALRLNDSADPCVIALKKAGLYDPVVKKLSDVNLVSIDEKGGENAAKYVPAQETNSKETLSEFFNRKVASLPYSNVAYASKKAIVTRSGVDAFAAEGLGATPIPRGFFLHEMIHHATGFNDARLVQDLGLSVSPGRTDSETISDYFKDECK